MASYDKIVTIGVPVYNEEQYLKQTILSLINQTYSKIFIVVSDNFSTDNSVKIIEEFQSSDNRIKLIKQVDNIGATENFKFLVDEANTEYFMWMGAHDIISETYIEDSVKLLNEENDAVLVYHKAVFFTDNINNVGAETYSKIDTQALNKKRRLMKIINVLGACTAVHGVFRTWAAKKIPFVKMVGPDHLMLYSAASLGHILQIDKNGFFRRQTNVNETIEQRRKRYEQYKMYRAKKITPSYKFAIEHIRYTFKIRELSVLNKVLVSINIIARVFVNYINFEILKKNKKQ